MKRPYKDKAGLEFPTSVLEAILQKQTMSMVNILLLY